MRLGAETPSSAEPYLLLRLLLLAAIARCPLRALSLRLPPPWLARYIRPASHHLYREIASRYKVPSLLICRFASLSAPSLPPIDDPGRPGTQPGPALLESLYGAVQSGTVPVDPHERPPLNSLSSPAPGHPPCPCTRSLSAAHPLGQG
ncbi:hypothetical protein F4802DRAFT_27345 [Xylaria palmicola]|nr:hypothetical protein F4802DRAFT_27345 [Xylaria palmicola]